MPPFPKYELAFFVESWYTVPKEVMLMNKEKLELLRKVDYPPLGNRPVEILQSRLCRNTDTMQTVLILRMKNVSGKAVTSLYLDICCFDEDVSLTGTKTREPFEHLSVKDGEIFGEDMYIPIASFRTQSITAAVTRVCYSDDEWWNLDDPPKKSRIAADRSDLSEVFAHHDPKTEPVRKRWVRPLILTAVLLLACLCGAVVAHSQVRRETVQENAVFAFSDGNYDDAKKLWKSLTRQYLFRSQNEDLNYYQALCDIKSKDYLSAMQTLAAQPNREKSVATLRQLNALLDGVLSAGKDHSAALRDNGTVVTAGDNSHGQCETDSWQNVVAVSAGWFHTLGLRIDGTVLAAGDAANPACDVSGWKNVVNISAGQNHSVAVLSNGTVAAVGDNSYGQCDTDSWKGMIAVAAGRNHTVGLRQDGSVLAVGDNPNGCCNVEKWQDIVSVSAGDGFTAGITKDGTVLTVGNPGCFAALPEEQTALRVAVGAYHTLLTAPNGSLVSVGNSDKHQTSVAQWSDVFLTAGGVWHSVGALPDGTAYAIGANGSGQCDVSGWIHVGLPASALQLTGIESECNAIGTSS